MSLIFTVGFLGIFDAFMHDVVLQNGKLWVILFGKLLSFQSAFGVEHFLALLLHTDLMNSGREVHLAGATGTYKEKECI